MFSSPGPAGSEKAYPKRTRLRLHSEWSGSAAGPLGPPRAPPALPVSSARASSVLCGIAPSLPPFVDQYSCRHASGSAHSPWPGSDMRLHPGAWLRIEARHEQGPDVPSSRMRMYGVHRSFCRLAPSDPPRPPPGRNLAGHNGSTTLTNMDVLNGHDLSPPP